jgi:hypothetical protein
LTDFITELEALKGEAYAIYDLESDLIMVSG